MRKAGRRRGARVVRVALWSVATLVLLALVVVVGTPVLLRGPILSRLVARQSKRLCGSVSLDGGHFDLPMVLSLLRQRPLGLVLEGVHVRDPDGREVLAAGRVRVTASVLRHPWRVVVEQAWVTGASWKLAQAKVKGQLSGFAAAFRPLPDSGPGACLVPGARRSRPPGTRSLVEVRAVSLEDTSIQLSFAAWGLTLSGVDAHGTLDIRATPERTVFLFDARDVRTDRGGWLRVGPAGGARSAEIPFDGVRIPRVAVTADAPKDLRLSVLSARAGPSELSGEALFTNVFARKPAKVGTELEARWTNLGAAVARTANWQALGRWLTLLGVGLKAKLHGPFTALTGAAALEGKGVSLRARLLPDARYRADVRFDRLRTAHLLSPGQRALLGGTLDGRLSVRAHLARSLLQTTVSLTALDLKLVRDRIAAVDRWPRHLVIEQRRGPAWASTRDEARLVVGGVGLRRGFLDIERLRLDGPGMQIAARAHAQLVRPPASRRPSSQVLAASATASLELGRLLPGKSISGPLRLGLAVKGSGGDFEVIGRSRPLPVTVWREEFLPPRLFSARLIGGRRLVIAPLAIEKVAGGTVRIAGWLRLDQRTMSIAVSTHAYRLAGMPGLAWALAPARHREIQRDLGGVLDAALKVTGRMARPSLSGQVAFSDVRYRRRELGHGAVSFQACPEGTRFEGTIVPSVMLRGELGLAPGPQGWLSVTVRDAPVGLWLPPDAAAFGLRSSGSVELRLSRHGRSLTTSAVTVTGDGVDLKAWLHVAEGRTEGRLKGRLMLDRAADLLPRLRLRRASGQVALDLHWVGNRGERRPRIDGDVGFGPVSVWSAVLGAPVRIAPAQFRIDGNQVSTPRLSLSTSGATATFAGTLVLQWADPRGSTVWAEVSAAVDGAGLRPWLGDRATASGQAVFSGHLEGSLRAPSLVGQTRFRALTVRWPGSPVGAVRLDGIVENAGQALLFRPLVARFESGGWMVLGAPDEPSVLAFTSLSPLRVGDLRLALRGGGLATLKPVGGLKVNDGSLDLRLRGSLARHLSLEGQVQLAHSSFDVSRKKKSGASGPPRPPGRVALFMRAMRDRLWLDVGLRGVQTTVRVPYAPDVTLDFACDLTGSAGAPALRGAVNGDGAYSRLVLAVADAFIDRDLHRCRVLPR
jgi:hypothetical protein